MRGPVPDKPSTRPTVPEVTVLARAYYAKPGDAAGGNLHVVLDDSNLDDSSISFCLERAHEAGDADGVVLAEKLLALTRTQRRRLSYNKYCYGSS